MLYFEVTLVRANNQQKTKPGRDKGVNTENKYVVVAGKIGNPKEYWKPEKAIKEIPTRLYTIMRLHYHPVLFSQN